MSMKMRRRTLVGAMAVAGAMGILAGCSQMKQMMGGESAGATQNITLSGNNEVPPVATPASGSGTVTVNPDRSVTVRITVTGMTATAAHIHEGAAGVNGPVIVPFTKSGDNTFVAPPGSKFTESQYAAFRAGNTYVNVHSAKNPPGEVRAQLRGN
jgi:CHRD domain-containing protein